MKLAIQLAIIALLSPFLIAGFFTALVYGGFIAGFVYAGEFLDWMRE